MNGYQKLANVYKNSLKDGALTEEERAATERKIAALEIMANTDRETQYELFNSSGFNDIVKGYLFMSLDNTYIEPEQQMEIKRELNYLFDTVAAEEAERYYIEH